MKRCLAAVGFGLLLVWTLLSRPVYSHNPTTTTVLFNREITTLLQRKCVQCHADGKLAMPLITFAQTRPWAEAIKEETLSRRMPPWPAERGFGAYSNDIGLTPREFEFLISWIDGGVPEGTDPAPALVDHADHWTLGMPDVVASPAAASPVEARSAPAFRRVTIDTGLARDAWIRAIDFKPDARVTRAAFFSVDGGGQYLGGWTPWLRVTADKERRDDPRVVSATPLSMVAINTTYDVPTYQPDTSWVTTSIGVAGRLAPKVGLSLVYTRVDGRTGIKEDGFSGMVSFQF